MTEAALVAAAGDRGAAGTLLHRYYRACWRFAYRMMGHAHDAEDVLANACRTALRQRSRRARRFVSSSDDDSGRLAGWTSPNESLAEEMSEPERQAMLVAAIQAALLRLEAKQREALLLKYCEEIEYTFSSGVPFWIAGPLVVTTLPLTQSISTTVADTPIHLASNRENNRQQASSPAAHLYT